MYIYEYIKTTALPFLFTIVFCGPFLAGAQEKKPAPPALSDFLIQRDVLQFNPEKNGVVLLPPKISYSVDQKSDLWISGLEFNDQTFNVKVGELRQIAPTLKADLNPNTFVLLFTAPTGLSRQAHIEILNEDGKSIFSKALQAEHFEHSLHQTAALLETEELRALLLNPKRKNGFRFCWNQYSKPFFSRLCSPFYRYSKKNQRLLIQTQTSSTKILIDQKEQPAEGVVELAPQQKIRFLATSSRGYSFEFFDQAQPLNLIDYFSDESLQWIYLVGHTTPPVVPAPKLFPAVPQKSLTAFFRWNATIGDTKDYWVTLIPKENPQLILAGRGGGLFQYPLQIEKIPSKSTRVNLQKPLLATYSSAPILEGKIDAKIKLQAQKGDTLKLSKEGQFLWRILLPDPGEEYESGLTVKDQDQEFQTFYSIYRGYSGEFSLRMAGVLSADLQLNLLGEMSFSQWYENLWGWDNYYLSRQRWGIAMRHFAPLKTFRPKGGTESPLGLQLSTLDFKYRLSPGLWERDETWGLILGFEDVKINQVKGVFGGVGLLWARSMPALFDSVFNWFPFMKYPKWVDVEFIYYLMPLSSNIKSGTNATYGLDFHGKILWSKTFFGEAGFGFKSYQYQAEEESVQLAALYGTAGLGFNF